MAEGELYGWPMALAVASIATALSLALLPPAGWRIRWLATPHFLGFFLAEMLRGGIDVARRAFHPAVPVAPGFLSHPLRLRHEAARLLMTWSVGLLPGTVSVELRADELDIHVLDSRMPTQRMLNVLEERIAALFG